MDSECVQHAVSVCVGEEYSECGHDTQGFGADIFCRLLIRRCASDYSTFLTRNVWSGRQPMPGALQRPSPAMAIWL